MTIEELMNKIDGIDIDSRDDCRYTEQELYEIGSNFIQLTNSEKRAFGGWDKLVEILQPLDRNGEPMKKGDTFRQWIKSRRYKNEEMIHNDHMLSGQNINDISFAEFEEKTEKLKQDLYKQQVKTRDTWNAYRKTMRAEAREEDFRDMFCEAVEKGFGKLEAKNFEGENVNDDVEMVVLFSDLHLGVEIDKYFNKFNVEIARERVYKYFTKIIERCELEHPTKVHFLNLGDLCAGHIHVSGRLEQEVDVIEQIMLACEILAENLQRLQSAAPEVIYRSCTDNHSRMTPNFKDNIEKENYGRIIDFYLQSRLKDTNIVFAEDNLDEEVGLFELLTGKKLVFAHGHHDNYNMAIQSYMGATKEFIDYIILGHYHASKMKSFQGVKVIINGSIVGTDQYAYSKRLFGDPEQTILVFKGDDVSIHNINLK